MLDLVQLLGLPFLACMAMVAILAYIGIHVLEREIIFIDIALAQIIAVGSIVARLVLGHHGPGGHDGVCIAPYVCTLCFALGASGFYAFARWQAIKIPLEAVIGVTYAIAAAAALFLAGIAPGHVHVREMLSGSILWVKWPQLLVSSLVFLAAGAGFFALHDRFKKISTDYDGAVSCGMNVLGWDFAFYVLVSVVITFAAPIGGVVVVFALLVIPATVGVLFSENLLHRLLMAWGIGILGSALGLIFADRLDFSVGSAVALFLGITLVVATLFHLTRPAIATAATVVAIAAYTSIILLVPAESYAVPRHTSAQGQGNSISAGGQDTRARSSQTAPSAQDPANIVSISELVALYRKTTDPGIRSNIVMRCLELETRAGVRLALRFLGENPPLLYRYDVVERLKKVAGAGFSFNIDDPYDAPANRVAVERLLKALEANKLNDDN